MTEEEKKAIEYIKSELQDEKEARDDYQSLTGLYGNLEIEIILNLIQKQDTEINKLKEKLDITKTNYEILQGEMDRIGIDTLHLEAGNSTDDVIDEINKLNTALEVCEKNLIEERTERIKLNNVIDEEAIKNNIDKIEEIQKLMENYDIIDDTTYEFFENIRSITDTHVRSLWNKIESGEHIPRID